MGKGAIAIGIIFILAGLWGAYTIVSSSKPILVIAYPLVSIGIGIAMIVLNEEEDKIEQRKDINNKKSK